MDELAAMRAFAKVVEAGSFSEVARQTDMSISSILRQVNGLEEVLGVRLLKRSTRQLAMTEAGQQYFRNVSSILHEIEAAKRAASTYQEGLKGTIKIHARTSAGTEMIVPALPHFLAQYPELQIDITLTDERADLLSEGIDLAIWLGNLEDSSMVARQLSSSRRLVCASPEYFKRNGVPESPQDLLQHNCLVFRSNHYSDGWRFRKDGESVTIPVAGNLKTANGAVLMTCAKNGLGIVLLQDWMVRSAKKEGLLQTALTDFEVFPTDYDTTLYVVYPHKDGLPHKVRVFIDFLMALFQERA
jgi:DNA-binding transcriptional LysR family regulator